MNGSVEIKIKQKHFEAKSREKNTRPEKHFAGSDNCNTNVTRYQIIKQDPMLQRDLFFFSIWVFFHEHSRITGLQGNGEGIS